MSEDIRWQQRLNNFERALKKLASAVKLSRQRELSELEYQGLIHAFEFTHELAWNCLKDFLEFKGQTEIYGSRDATRKAFELQLIDDGEAWMDMIQSRNRTSHTYNHKVMQEITTAIIDSYYPLFNTLVEKMNTLQVE